ncbi:MAG: recombination regulator RecX [Clostridiales bacterium]|nr:recombination regulator RecX [Clostridiales bacterium]
MVVIKQDLTGDGELVRKAALRYLGRREYSAFELRQRLERRGASLHDIKAAIAYAQSNRYLDDGRAAEAHIRQRLNYAPRGRALIAYELKERGISQQIGDTLLEIHYPTELERELLLALLAKETKLEQDRMNKKELWKLRQKVARRLLAKGFPQDLVMEVLEEWNV